MMKISIAVIGVAVFCCLTVRTTECKGRKTQQIALKAKETNVANFVRLVVMRLVFGVASVMGFGENLSGVFGGILVPPGAEDDYGDYSDNDYGSDLF